MRTLATLAEAADFRSTAPSPVVLVPTMGALHAGHAALIDAARTRAGREGTVVVSIFVNPTQFGPHEDLAKYPRTLDADLELCAAHGADAVFTPAATKCIPRGDSTYVDETDALARTLRRGPAPGISAASAPWWPSFSTSSVPTPPSLARRTSSNSPSSAAMTRDLFLGIDIIGHPTVREPDGLAMSSRNRYLGADERKRAAAFPAALSAAARETDPALIVAKATELITAGTGSAPQYVAVVDAETLEPLEALDRPAVLAAAVKIGETRLIDNVRVAPRHGKI